MANLKELKVRIQGIKSTQKITRAMRMVAAAKLLKAKRTIEKASGYITKMQQVVQRLANSTSQEQKISPLIDGTGSDKIHLLILVTSDRGLCGSFNSSLVKELVKKINILISQEKEFKIFCIGKKGYDLLKGKYQNNIISVEAGLSRAKVTMVHADKIAMDILKIFEKQEFDIAHIIYSEFKSAITQQATAKQIVPVEKENNINNGVSDLYEFEPNENEILKKLLPKNISVEIYKALLQSMASEHAARTNAMENATNNAKDMIQKLTLKYNRTRQANITKELIEIISGAEALK